MQALAQEAPPQAPVAQEDLGVAPVRGGRLDIVGNRDANGNEAFGWYLYGEPSIGNSSGLVACQQVRCELNPVQWCAGVFLRVVGFATMDEAEADGLNAAKAKGMNDVEVRKVKDFTGSKRWP